MKEVFYISIHNLCPTTGQFRVFLVIHLGGWCVVLCGRAVLDLNSNEFYRCIIRFRGNCEKNYPFFI